MQDFVLFRVNNPCQSAIRANPQFSLCSKAAPVHCADTTWLPLTNESARPCVQVDLVSRESCTLFLARSSDLIGCMAVAIGYPLEKSGFCGIRIHIAGRCFAAPSKNWYWIDIIFNCSTYPDMSYIHYQVPFWMWTYWYTLGQWWLGWQLWSGSHNVALCSHSRQWNTCLWKYQRYNAIVRWSKKIQVLSSKYFVQK